MRIALGQSAEQCGKAIVALKTGMENVSHDVLFDITLTGFDDCGVEAEGSREFDRGLDRAVVLEGFGQAIQSSIERGGARFGGGDDADRAVASSFFRFGDFVVVGIEIAGAYRIAAADILGAIRRCKIRLREIQSSAKDLIFTIEEIRVK